MKDSNVPLIIRQFVRTQTTVDVDRYSDVGGMSALYFGDRKIISDRVAMKFYAIDPLGIAHNEPFLLKSLESDNILKIYHAEIISNQFAYYLTPEMSGGDLQDYLNKNIISTDLALNLLAGILSGLSELHNKRLVHRDIKTLNVLLDATTLNPVIADFGFVRYIPDGSTSTSASSNTHLYRSKEMILSNVHNFQSDIYQVGVILFQLLGGYFPFTIKGWISLPNIAKFNSLKTEAEKADFWYNLIDEKVKKNKLLNLETLPPYIPKQLKRIITIATHPDMKIRYKTCAEFKAAIFNFRMTYKNWWTDGKDVYAKNKKGDKTYIVENYKSHAQLKVSVKNSIFRNRNVGISLEEIVEYIAND